MLSAKHNTRNEPTVQPARFVLLPLFLVGLLTEG